MVLLIPTVLAMLGDNPMQSEFACHVGLAGKFFCRCCWVKGRDAEDEAISRPQRERAVSPISDTASIGSAQSANSSQQSSVKGSRRRHPETLAQLKDRAKRFLEVCDFFSNLTPYLKKFPLETQSPKPR